jgi:predicted nuclease with TOPRIM domain
MDKLERISDEEIRKTADSVEVDGDGGEDTIRRLVKAAMTAVAQKQLGADQKILDGVVAEKDRQIEELKKDGDGWKTICVELQKQMAELKKESSGWEWKFEGRKVAYDDLWGRYNALTSQMEGMDDLLNIEKAIAVNFVDDKVCLTFPKEYIEKPISFNGKTFYFEADQKE